MNFREIGRIWCLLSGLKRLRVSTETVAKDRPLTAHGNAGANKVIICSQGLGRSKMPEETLCDDKIIPYDYDNTTFLKCYPVVHFKK